MVISFMVFALRKGGIISQEYDNQRADQQIADFNTKFEVYQKDDNNIFDIITVANLAWNENEKNGNDSQNEIIVKINLNSAETIFYQIKIGCEKNSFLDENNHKVYFYDATYNGEKLVNAYGTIVSNGENVVKYNYLFECQGIKYNNITGKVKTITFKIKNT